MVQDGTWRQCWDLGAGLCAHLPKQKGLLELSSSPSPDQVLGDDESTGKWKETWVLSEKHFCFASNRPPSVLEVSCGAGRCRLSTFCGAPSCKRSLGVTNRVFSSVDLGSGVWRRGRVHLVLLMKEQGFLWRRPLF